MRRRDFTTGLLPASAVRIVTAEEPAKRHRIAIVEAGSVTGIDEPGSRPWQPFWKVFRLLGNAEGKISPSSGVPARGGEGYGNLAQQVVNRNPDVIVAVTDPIARAVRAAIPTDQVLVPDQSESRQSPRPYRARPHADSAPPAEAGVILVDTSVWVDHLRAGDQALAGLLEAGKVLAHPFVIGELALRNLTRRDQVVRGLQDLPQANVATDREVLHFVGRHLLFGRGLGYVDAHLLAAVLLTAGARLWTRDRRLKGAADYLGLAITPPR